jgi:hypothetical protein
MLPAEIQDGIARLVLAYTARDRPPISLTPDEEADLAEAEVEAARGELATDEQMDAIWAKHRL